MPTNISPPIEMKRASNRKQENRLDERNLVKNKIEMIVITVMKEQLTSKYMFIREVTVVLTFDRTTQNARETTGRDRVSTRSTNAPSMSRHPVSSSGTMYGHQNPDISDSFNLGKKLTKSLVKQELGDEVTNYG